MYIFGLFSTFVRICQSVKKKKIMVIGSLFFPRWMDGVDNERPAAADKAAGRATPTDFLVHSSMDSTLAKIDVKCAADDAICS